MMYLSILNRLPTQLVGLRLDFEIVSYWSSTTYALGMNYAWGVYFDDGVDSSSSSDSKDSSYCVRAVRGGQSGSLGNLVISPSSRSVTKDAGTTNFSVSNSGTGTMSWTAAVTSGGEWLRITSGSSGANAGTIACGYDANTTTASRTGTIRVTAAGATGSPKDVTVIQAPGVVTQSSVKFWGAWPDGVYTWKQSTNQWTKIAGTGNVMQIAAGNIAGGTVDDLVGVWSSGLWVRYAGSGQWLNLKSALPNWIATGDMTNDGRDDLIGIWSDGVWVRYEATGKWQRISSTKPVWITTGRTSD